MCRKASQGVDRELKLKKRKEGRGGPWSAYCNFCHDLERLLRRLGAPIVIVVMFDNKILCNEISVPSLCNL
jgi:hypothetical protein